MIEEDKVTLCQAVSGLDLDNGSIKAIGRVNSTLPVVLTYLGKKFLIKS